MTLLSQKEVELQMFSGGVGRAISMMDKAEEKGSAARNPYSQEIMREYVFPLARAIAAGCVGNTAGRSKAHCVLLRALNPEAVAFLSVRVAINTILKATGAQPATTHSLGYEIGKTIHNELVLIQIEEQNPAMYHALSRELGRRLSKDERYRMIVYKAEAAKAGLPVVEWPIGARQQVGFFILSLLQQSGMIDIDEPTLSRNQHAKRCINLGQDILRRIDEIRFHVSITLPMYGPCVVPPVPWTSWDNGGFHTKELRRANPHMVRHRRCMAPLYENAQMGTVFNAINALQDTRWKVNTRILDISLEVAKHFSVGDIASLADVPRPSEPSFLKDAPKDKTTWPEDQQVLFKAWKVRMRDWWIAKKVAGTRYGRFYTATRSANTFRDYPNLHFVHFADSRGRLYPMTYGINPQGSDIQKALITFANPLPLEDDHAVHWFHVHGANKYGFDKATLQERHQWVLERQDMIHAIGSDPLSNLGWKDADKPLQFLAWCLEYKDYMEATARRQTAFSALPISMDGSCNGLQNLSALLRDEIGGRATNLTDNSTMEDIYRRVAEAATERMLGTAQDDPLKEELRVRWIKHKISRSVVKRSVMTTPYGVTKRSAIDYVISDYLMEPANNAPFVKEEYMKAAGVLMDYVWPAIGDVVVKGRQVMDWLRKSATMITKQMKEEHALIDWVSPSGFPASQAYFEDRIHRINTMLAGAMKIRVLSEADEASVLKNAKGMAPNFVHSMDAAHLHLTTEACVKEGIVDLAMIHDDYGTHAANSQAMFRIIREQFVRMYEENDPIAQFKERYPFITEPPPKGALEIRDVLRSQYFFS